MGIPGQDAVVRFQENEDRLNTFLNTLTPYLTNLGVSVESIPHLIDRLQNTLNMQFLLDSIANGDASVRNDLLINIAQCLIDANHYSDLKLGAANNYTDSGISNLTNTDNLTNIGKMSLIADYKAEIAIQVGSGTTAIPSANSLDAQANVKSISHTNYDNYIKALSDNLISSGAPSNWLSIWPDDLTFTKSGILISLSSWWINIVTARETLKLDIVNAAAAAAQSAAIASAASTAMQKSQFTSDGVHIQGTTLAGGSITAAAMANSNSTNLIPNPSSANTGFPAGSIEIAGSVYIGTGYAFAPGGYIRRITYSGNPTQIAISPFIQCSSGEKFFLSGQAVYNNIVRGNIRIGIAFYDSAKAYIGGSAVVSASGTTSAIASPSSLSVSNETTPYNACYVQFYIQQDSANIGDTSYFNNFYAGKIIVAGMLAASSVIAGNVAAKAIMVENLTVADFTNLIPNPNCLNTTPPAGSLESLALYNVGAIAPTTIGTKLSPNGWVRRVDAPAGGNTYYSINEVTCTPDDTFNAVCQAAFGNNGTGQVWLGFSFFDANDSVVGNFYSSSIVPTYDFNAPSVLSLTQKAPAGSVKVRCFIQLYNPYVGNWVVFNNFLMRRCSDANVIVDGTLQALFIKLYNSLSSNNYVSSTVNGGLPIGLKLSGIPFPTQYLDNTVANVMFEMGGDANFGGWKVATVNNKLNGMGSNTLSGSSYRTWYRGNNDPNTNGGRPNINRCTVATKQWSATYAIGRHDLIIQPMFASDNLDGMREAKIELFSQSVAGTSFTLVTRAIYYLPLPDRSYATNTDTDSVNAIHATLITVDAASQFPAMKVTISNAAGTSDTHCFYSPAGWVAGNLLTDNGTSWPAGASGAPGGGSGSGGGGGGPKIITMG